MYLVILLPLVTMCICVYTDMLYYGTYLSLHVLFNYNSNVVFTSPPIHKIHGQLSVPTSLTNRTLHGSTAVPAPLYTHVQYVMVDSIIYTVFRFYSLHMNTVFAHKGKMIYTCRLAHKVKMIYRQSEQCTECVLVCIWMCVCVLALCVDHL